MTEFEHTIRIDAPAETVFEFLLDPETALAVNASVHEIEDVQTRPDGGYTAHMTYKIGGLETEGEVQAEVVEPNEEIVYRFDGVGMNGTLTWRSTERDGTTELVEYGVYETTGTVLDRVLEPVARSYNERQFLTAFNNLKTYVEVILRSR